MNVRRLQTVVRDVAYSSEMPERRMLETVDQARRLGRMSDDAWWTARLAVVTANRRQP